MTKERLKVFKEYLRKWPWDRYSTMPIAKEEADYLIELFDKKEREAAQKAAWYQGHKEKCIEKGKARYSAKKASVFERD